MQFNITDLRLCFYMGEVTIKHSTLHWEVRPTEIIPIGGSQESAAAGVGNSETEAINFAFDTLFCKRTPDAHLYK